MHTIDERGKYFTDRVHTQHVEVLVLTVKGEVRGHAHLPPGTRIKDLLNSTDQFVALTDATISGYDPGTRQVGFIAVNKLHIISVIPLQDQREEQHESDEPNRGGY